jgi:hypothetical protein
MAQIDWIFYYTGLDMRSFDKIIISNNGSVFDEKTFSTTALLYLIAKINMHAPNATKICMETRPEYVDISEMEVVHRALKEGNPKTALEIAVGLEVFDDTIRNDVFNKGLSKDKFEHFASLVAAMGFHIKCYMMLKPVPGMSQREGIEDIHKAIDYLCGISRECDTPVNVHINPTYVARGTELEKAFNEYGSDGNRRYTPPTLNDLAAAVYVGAAVKPNKDFSIFVGLDDEGLAVEGGSFIREGEENLVDMFEDFNRTQNYKLIEDILLCQSTKGSLTEPA